MERLVGLAAHPRALVVLILLATSTAFADGPAVLVPVGKYTLAAPGEWKHELVVYPLDDKDVPLAELVVVPQMLQDSSGARQIPVAVVSKTSVTGTDRFNRKSPARVVIRATLDRADNYTGALYVSAGGAPAVVELAIEVKASAPTAPRVPPLAVSGVAEARSHVGESTSIAVWLSSSGDAPEAVHAVKVMGRFAPKTGEGSASEGKVSIAVLTPALTILPRATEPLRIQLPAFDEPGEYEGALEISVDDGVAPVTGSIKILVRRALIWAILAIGAGVIVPLVVVWVRDRVKPRAELGLACERYASQLSAIVPATDAIALARQRLGQMLGELRDESRTGEPSTTKPKVEAFSERIALLVAANASAIAIGGLSSTATRGVKRKVIDDVLVIAVDPTAKVDDGYSLLRGLGVDGAKRTELGESLDALDLSVDEHRRSADTALVKSIEQTVDPPLARAHTARDADDLVSLSHELGLARAALAVAGSRSILDAIKHKPAWFDDASWNDFHDAMVGTLRSRKPGTASQRYEALRNDFVSKLADAVLLLGNQRQTDLKMAKRPDDETLNAAITHLAAAKATAADPAADVMKARSQLAAATRSLQNVLASAAGKPGDIVKTSFAHAGTSEATVVPIEGDTELSDTTSTKTAALVAFTPASKVAWKHLRNVKRSSDLVITFVALVLALLSGVKLLWVDNATWGGEGDLLTAFLWGTGVKLTADAFSGLSWLRGALGKGAA